MLSFHFHLQVFIHLCFHFVIKGRNRKQPNTTKYVSHIFQPIRPSQNDWNFLFINMADNVL